MTKIASSNFKRLIGIWKTTGTILKAKDNAKIVGTDSYEFILDGNYILHKADVIMGDEKSETFEIISLDHDGNKTKMHYYNSKGESGIMTASLIENNYKIKGDKINFDGTINDENTLLSGKWFLQSDDGEWTDFIDLKLTKQK